MQKCFIVFLTQVFEEEEGVDEVDGESLCGMCEEEAEKAEWFCRQCTVLYCTKCVELFHPKRGSLRNHHLSKPSKVPNKA